MIRTGRGRMANVEFSGVVFESRQAAEDVLNRENVLLTYPSSARRDFELELHAHRQLPENSAV